MSSSGHVGEKHLEALLRYNDSKNVLSVNTFELRRFIGEIESYPLQSLFGSEEFRNRLHSMNGHLLRYIHNFLSSHMTYMEHVDVLMRSPIIRPAHYGRYAEKKRTTFDSDPLLQFTHHFRNYVVHTGLPSAAHVSHSNSNNPNLTVYVELDKIPNWQKWNKSARTFVNAHLPHLRLQWYAQEHEKLMATFNTWFALEYYAEYKSEMEDFEKHHQKPFDERFRRPA